MLWDGIGGRYIPRVRKGENPRGLGLGIRKKNCADYKSSEGGVVEGTEEDGGEDGGERGGVVFGAGKRNF